MKRVNPKIIMLLGSLIMLGSILAASYMKTWWTFVIFYAFGFPIGIGLVYWTPIICAWEYFPNRKGLISGLVIGAFGFGAFIFGFVSTGVANPEDAKPRVPDDGSGTTDKLFPKEVAERVPEMFRTCLMYWAALSFVAICTVSRNPEATRK